MNLFVPPNTDIFPLQYHCCGALTFSQWRDSRWLQEGTGISNAVPDSCCKTPSPYCGESDHPSNIWYNVSTHAIHFLFALRKLRLRLDVWWTLRFLVRFAVWYGIGNNVIKRSVIVVSCTVTLLAVGANFLSIVAIIIKIKFLIPPGMHPPVRRGAGKSPSGPWGSWLRHLSRAGVWDDPVLLPLYQTQGRGRRVLRNAISMQVGRSQRWKPDAAEEARQPGGSRRWSELRKGKENLNERCYGR